MKKMKGIDFKALLVNHGEKIGAVVVALLGIMGLATAHWSPETRVEDMLVKKANDTKAKMESTTWPDDKREVFEKTPDVRELTHKMQNPDQDVARFAPSVSFSEPLQKMKAKRSAPVVLAPLFPEASLVTVPLALVPEDKAATDEESKDGKEKGKDEEKESDEDRERRERLGPIAGNALGGELGGNGLGGGGLLGGPGSLGGGGASGPPGMGGGGPGMGGDPRGGGMDPRGGGAGGPPGMGGGPGRGGDPRGGGSDPRGGGAGGPPGMGGGPGRGGDPRGGGAGGPPGMGGGSGMLGGGGLLGGGGGLLGGGGELGDMYGDYSDYSGMLGTNVASKRIQYAAGVSVRMIFDLREQRKKIAEALQMNPGDPLVARYAEDFAEIHIERKKAIAAQDPWSGEWEPVQVEDLEESMAESLGFDLEIVNPMVTRPVITMPLPRRVTGRWGKKEASHTQLENFVLTAEEQELIRKRDEKLAREAEERKAKLPPTKKKGGFANLRGNASDYMSSLYGSGQGEDQFYNDFIEDYSNELSSEGEADASSSDDTKKKKNKEKLEEMKKKLFSAVDRLLLVRIIDFTAERGQKYIYRIRIEMYNPNYGKPVDSLVTPELAEQLTIVSDWSQPSPPVTVPMDYRYYVQKVAAQQGSEESAQLSVYYEAPELGTPVMTDLSVPVGVRIGGEKEIEAVDLSKSILGRTKIDIKSRDLLASVVESPKISAGDHPELQAVLSKVPRGSKAIPDQVTVVDASGAIILRSSGDAATAQKYDQDDFAFLLKEYEKAGWKRDAKAEGNASDPFDLYGGGQEGGLGAGAGMGSGMGMGYGDPLGGKSGRGRGSRGGRGPGM